MGEKKTSYEYTRKHAKKIIRLVSDNYDLYIFLCHILIKPIFFFSYGITRVPRRMSIILRNDGISRTNYVAIISGEYLVVLIKASVQPRGSILTSFDVVGLHHNIPIEPTLQFAEKLFNQVVSEPDVVTVFFKLLRVCLTPNICQYEGEVYQNW